MKTFNPTPKYIDPMNDFGFKKIFKESGKKQLLIRPLNAIFGLDIADLEIREGEQLGSTPKNRNATFDLYCESADHKKFIVEVQLARQEYFIERALFYTTFPIARSAPKGRRARKKWNFDYPPVFFLGMLDFDISDRLGAAADRRAFIQRCSLRHDTTGERITDRLQFAFLEIKRFDKRIEECQSFEDKFLYMMKNLPTFVDNPAMWSEDPYFGAMLEEAEYARMDERQQEEYRESMRRDWDYWNTIDYAEQTGVKKGLEQGLERGLEQGLERGRAEGQAAERQAIARRMLMDGLSVEVVALYTGLEESRLRQLRDSSESDPVLPVN